MGSEMCIRDRNDGTKADMLYISIYYCDSTTILTNSVVEFVLFSVEYSMRCFHRSKRKLFLVAAALEGRRDHNRWVHYTTDPTVSGGSMNPSSRQRRYHNRWVHYTIIAGALRRSGRASGWPYFFRNTEFMIQCSLRRRNL